MQPQSQGGAGSTSGLSSLQGGSVLPLQTPRALEAATDGRSPAADLDLTFCVSKGNPLKRLGRAVTEMLTGVRGRAKRSQRRNRRAPRLPFASLSAASLPEQEATETREEAPSAALPPALPPALDVFSAATTHRHSSPFPLTLAPRVTSHQQEGSQRLLAVGSRHWGSASWWDTRSLLRIKIYDFAVYANPDSLVQDAALTAQARLVQNSLGHSSVVPQVGEAVPRGPYLPRSGRVALAHLVKAPLMRRPQACSGSAAATDATIVMHAARDLPVKQLTMEMQSVLFRRNIKAGGSQDDPALSELLDCLSSLPASLLSSDREHVQRGGVISFHRSCRPSSGLHASGAAGARRQEAEDGLPDACSIQVSADGQVLANVKSNSLSSALFDLYLGDDPVSIKAKAAAAKSLQHDSEASSGRRKKLARDELQDTKASTWSSQHE